MDIGIVLAGNNLSNRNSTFKSNQTNNAYLFKNILVENSVRETIANNSSEIEDMSTTKDVPDDYLTLIHELQEILNDDGKTSHSYSELLEILLHLKEDLSLDNMHTILDKLEQPSEEYNTEVNFSTTDLSFLTNDIKLANQDQMNQLLVKIDRLLQSITNGSFNFNDYKQLMNSMKEWMELQKIDQKSAEALLDTLKEPQKKLWGELIDKYTQKIKQENMYTNQNQLTYDTISKWINSALSEAESVVKISNDGKLDYSTSTLQSTNMSKIEQYVIHIQQTNTTEQASQQKIVEQFQQILEKSTFLKGPNGSNQLFIRLQPEHLGDVVIKLTQINGEMIVKLVVQSQMAKDMLEGNLQQLRHLFSPQQVIIEKQEVVMTQNDSEPSLNDQKDSNNPNDHQSNDGFLENEVLDYEDELDFNEILMDMKV